MGIFSHSDLEERIRKLETAQKELALEWELAYEKLLKLMGRIAKRTAETLPSEPPAGPAEPLVDVDAGNPQVLRALTPRQHAIQNSVLRRRRLLRGA